MLCRQPLGQSAGESSSSTCTHLQTNGQGDRPWRLLPSSLLVDQKAQGSKRQALGRGVGGIVQGQWGLKAASLGASLLTSRLRERKGYRRAAGRGGGEDVESQHGRESPI